MAQHLWTVFCQTVITNAETNATSLIESIEEIVLAPRSDDEPALGDHLAGPPMTIASLWMRSNLDEGEVGTMQYQLLGPDEAKPTQVAEAPVALEEHVRARTITRIGGITFRGLGRYTWVVRYRSGDPKEPGRWRTVAKVPFQMLAAPQDEQAPSARERKRKPASKKL